VKNRGGLVRRSSGEVATPDRLDHENINNLRKKTRKKKRKKKEIRLLKKKRDVYKFIYSLWKKI
jgi:hypothetical protein